MQKPPGKVATDGRVAARTPPLKEGQQKGRPNRPKKSQSRAPQETSSPKARKTLKQKLGKKTGTKAGRGSGEGRKSLPELVAELDKSNPSGPGVRAQAGSSAVSENGGNGSEDETRRKLALLEQALRSRSQQQAGPEGQAAEPQQTQDQVKQQAPRAASQQSGEAQRLRQGEPTPSASETAPGLLQRLKDKDKREDHEKEDRGTEDRGAKEKKAKSGGASSPPSKVTEASETPAKTGTIKPENAKPENAAAQSGGSGMVAAAQQHLSKAAGGMSRQASLGLRKLKRRSGQYVRLGRKIVWRGVRKRTNPRAFVQDYRRLLTLIHRYIFDREIEQLFFVPTARRIRLHQLTITSPNRGGGHDYWTIPRLLFDWIMDVLPADLRGFEFYDIGAGRGRLLLLASRYNFDKIRGCEFAAELHDDAEMNIAQFPRSLMKCRDVACYHQDALEMPLPEVPLVLFFVDPFSEAMLERMMSRIVASYQKAPRPVYLVFVAPPSRRIMRQLVEKTDIFVPLAFRRMKALMIRFFSPSQVRIYKSKDITQI